MEACNNTDVPFDLYHRTFLAHDHVMLDCSTIAAHDVAGLDLLPLQFRLDRRALQQGPHLLDLRALSLEQRMVLLDRACDWQREHGRSYFAALIAADAPERVHLHLKAQMQVQRPGDTAVWLRLHDPRAFRHFAWLLDGPQLRRLMGPIHTWSWHDPLTGQWFARHRPEENGELAMRWSAAQWQQLDRFGVLNMCLREWVWEGGVVSDEVVHGLCEGIAQAEDAGLEDAADLGLFARQRMRDYRGFLAQPQLLARLERMADQRISYVMACRLEEAA
jgi:hypothetical protein